MADIIPQFNNEEFWKCCFDLKASKIERGDLRPRGKETIRSLRREFYHAVRQMFLKYLPSVDKEYMEKTFSPEQIEIMRHYRSKPEGWNIHHQKSLSWGGRNLNPDLIDEIEKYSLTEEQKEIFDVEFQKILEEERIPLSDNNPEIINQRAECRNILIFRFQLDNYLDDAQKKNKLETTFCRLFKGFLILLPKEKHDNLEKFIEAQKSALFSNGESREFQQIAPTVRIYYPTWNQLVYGGNSFKEVVQKEIDISRSSQYKKSPEIRSSKFDKPTKKERKRGKLVHDILSQIPNKDEKKTKRREYYLPEKIGKKKLYHLKQKAFRRDDYEHDD